MNRDVEEQQPTAASSLGHLHLIVGIDTGHAIA
jgi:hypothetical protein